ncbi:Uncharacterized protein APZ42_033384 [Daphnia magna]|uniref:BED-type domain-containing protein n=1 Tax=Daphnia magna TaxID=35525 RepID=A0A164L541_9CRUS|nr:Uncharacterized protein APZ42_033384 [Daphnia magna]
MDWREGADERVHCLCKTCRNYFSTSKKAYTNFWIHLERRHSEEWKQFHNKANQPCSHSQQQASITAFTTETKIHPSRQATLDRLATRMLVTGNIPLIFFRNPEWKEFVKVIIPGYKAPTDFTMRRRHIGEEYDQIKMLECPTKINIGSLYWHRLHVTYWESLLLRPTLNDASAQR